MWHDPLIGTQNPALSLSFRQNWVSVTGIEAENQSGGVETALVAGFLSQTQKTKGEIQTLENKIR